MRLDKGYHYFQYLGENRTKYINIINADPNISYIPEWMINFMMSKICHEQLKLIQHHTKNIVDSPFALRIKEKRHYYGPIEEELKKTIEVADDDAG